MPINPILLASSPQSMTKGVWGDQPDSPNSPTQLRQLPSAPCTEQNCPKKRDGFWRKLALSAGALLVTGAALLTIYGHSKRTSLYNQIFNTLVPSNGKLDQSLAATMSNGTIQNDGHKPPFYRFVTLGGVNDAQKEPLGVYAVNKNDQSQLLETNIPGSVKQVAGFRPGSTRMELIDMPGSFNFEGSPFSLSPEGEVRLPWYDNPGSSFLTGFYEVFGYTHQKSERERSSRGLQTATV